ncbi:phage shock protein B [Catenovulum agarivorans DS-2]|uniref:Phage shock protein B n=1 Tax=Catenovulum agarivorans DS-2 TaxID=1328313 RepID=W7QJ07_9ALTE|nr:envelope stress response membrane protein PspB [Catenovulum agarivorans]EWH11856.1 phage shock protein B [Catenovulum agarivorans DS-2]
MTALVGLLVAPIIIFLIFVAPIWLILSYRSKKQLNQGLTEAEQNQLIELSKKAERMADRIEVLENLLDIESPNWRQTNDSNK